MSARMADRLSAARHQLFVGRAGEREFFRSALAAAEWPFQLLFVFGPGGVGKTALLLEMASQCAEADAPVTYVDARNVEPSPDSFLNALRRALDLAPHESPLSFLASHPSPVVILIHTLHTLRRSSARCRCEISTGKRDDGSSRSAASRPLSTGPSSTSRMGILWRSRSSPTSSRSGLISNSNPKPRRTSSGPCWRSSSRRCLGQRIAPHSKPAR